MPFKMHKINFFSCKKKRKKSVPTLPKIFRSVARNPLIFLFGLILWLFYVISDWEGEEEDKDDKYVWEDNWDDDNIGDDFSILLR